MARPTTKKDLIEASNSGYESLMAFIDSMTEQELATPFDFSGDEKKKEAHWQRDKNLRDVLVHLHEWQNLTLDWVPSNQKGEAKPFLPKPYNWNSPIGKSCSLRRALRTRSCLQRASLTGWVTAPLALIL